MTGSGLSTRFPLGLRRHHLGLDAGAGVNQVVAEEYLRGGSAGSAVLGHVVSTDVDGGGCGFIHELDGGRGSVSTAHTVGLAFGGLDDQEDAAVVSGSLVRWPSVRGGVRESLADLLRQSLPAKGGKVGCWSGCLVRSAAENQTDRRASTAFLISPGIGTAAGTGHHRPERLY